jgi:uncharacterized membrane protein YqaE (UPF0057 family)
LGVSKDQGRSRRCSACFARRESKKTKGTSGPCIGLLARPTRRPKVGPNRRPETKRAFQYRQEAERPIAKAVEAHRAQGPGSGDSASLGIRKTWGRPPVGVCLEVGFKGHFWQNIVLTLLGYIPGIIHAQYVILRH